VKFYRTILKEYRKRQYHTRHKNEAIALLKSIESETGKLKSKLRKMSDEYARDVLGWVGFAPWLYVYCAISGDFKYGWIPDNYYGAVIVPKLKGIYGTMSNGRALTYKLFNGKYFPDIAYYDNGLLLSYSQNGPLMGGGGA
jgi:hypothetical protein